MPTSVRARMVDLLEVLSRKSRKKAFRKPLKQKAMAKLRSSEPEAPDTPYERAWLSRTSFGFKYPSERHRDERMARD